jgi:hypothetical protein
LRPPSPLRYTDSVSQSGFDSTTASEQGSYGAGCFVFSNTVYQGSGNANATVLDSARDTFGGSATDSSSAAGNGIHSTADGIRSTGALDTAMAYDNGLFSVQGSDRLGDTVVATDNWTVYEAGSWGGLSWSLPCVVYGDTFAQTDGSTACGTDTATAFDSTTGNATTLFGGGSFTGADTVRSADSSVNSVTGSSGDTINETGQQSFSIVEQGSNSGTTYGFSFNCLVFQGSDAANETVTDQTGDTFGGSATDSTRDTGLGNQGGLFAVSSAGAIGSFAGNDSGTFHDTGGNLSITGFQANAGTMIIDAGGQHHGQRQLYPSLGRRSYSTTRRHRPQPVRETHGDQTREPGRDAGRHPGE